MEGDTHVLACGGRRAVRHCLADPPLHPEPKRQRVSWLLPFPADGKHPPEPILLARGIPIHQLARLRTGLALHSWYQSILGGVARYSVWLVGLRARPDDRDIPQAVL